MEQTAQRKYKYDYNQIAKGFESISGVIFTEYSGLTVGEMTELRGKLKKQAAKYIVVKNRITSAVLKQLKITDLNDLFKGPTALLVIKESIEEPIKILVDFSKEHENLKIKKGLFSGRIFEHDKIVSIAKLPNRNVLIAELASLLKTNLVNILTVLQAPMRDFINVLEQIKVKKEKGE
ncbi:MAG: 50S ribosomal protein L10 [Elusimicrobia bacterium CG1_02_37_114]|nr:MAG: 50S ribosomal protein L10 [Elusimicrobia bacterium CG1_02_37_114]PIV53886.1 MAG: 50S ribosomal protein L10 [Elusimicrobia bacterium CG02_land_8_20_14_3_00_37_13]PIZ14380.1 MAG: 50S ribosomal protein L10 [Elusimicrobia bacterium CG_4_10_14_0_8_um_filter_37_32]